MMDNTEHGLHSTLIMLKDLKKELEDFVAPPSEHGWALSNLPCHFWETLGECIDDVENYIKEKP